MPKLLKDNLGKNLDEFEYDNGFLNTISKPNSIKEIIY